MSSEDGSDSGREAMSWGRGQEEESSSGRLVEGIDNDEVLSPAPLKSVPPTSRSAHKSGVSGAKGGRPLGRREMEVEAGQRTAPVWKCRFFPSEVNEKQLADWHRMYSVPPEIEFIVPGPNDRADDPPLGCVALNQAVLAAGLRLPFPRIVRKFLREWGIAPTQLCPNGWRILLGFLILWDQFGFPRPSVGEFNSLYSFKSDGRRSGWWYASVKPRTGGSVVTQTPDSIKNWKQFWFFVRGPWQFSVNDTGPHVNIPVRYHELRYTSHEPAPEFVERARQVRAVDESFRSSSVLITEENLASARLSSTTLSNSRSSQSGKQMKDISALLKKKGQAGKGKRKAPSEGQPPAARPRTEEVETQTEVPSPARSVEEIASFPTRGEPSSPPVCRPPQSSSQIPPRPSPRIPPTYLGSTPERDEEYLKLRGSIPKPLRDFFRSNSPTRGDIVELPGSARRAISVLGKSWTPDQQKYLDTMGTVESIVAASVNTSRAAIQLTSAAEKMGRMLNDIQVMREEGKKTQVELTEEKRLRALSEDALLKLEEGLRKKEDELKAMSDELEAVNKSKADLEHDLEGERKSNAELKVALEKSADKDEAVAEFRSSNAYLAEQEVVYFLTMEELIETTSEKRPDWDVQFLRDELADLKRKPKLNPPSPEEVDQDLAEADQARSGE
ncbi:ABC transmembrane type-1 domain-containing protein [Abeliophyllum distichum]|uniref:ABC transmembrane type-1 domain-containing protein n=1 Tax=Abeliophyllum distichum TaxID=126358 RepID=A0ABD1W0Z8_9LAMI